MFFIALLSASVTAVILRVIAEVLRLFISSRKRNNSSYQSTTQSDNLSYRVIGINGCNCLRGFYQGIITSFFNLLTFVDGISEPHKKEYDQEAEKQHSNFPHHGKSNTAKNSPQPKQNFTSIVKGILPQI